MRGTHRLLAATIASLVAVGVSSVTSGPAKADTTAQLQAERAQLLLELAALVPGVDSAQAALAVAETAYSQQAAALSESQSNLDTLNAQLSTLNGEILDDQFQAASAQHALAALARATYESVTGDTVMTAVLSAKDFSSAMSSLSGASRVTTQIQGLEKTLDQEKSSLESAQRQTQADIVNATTVENQVANETNDLEAVVAQRDAILNQMNGPSLQIAVQIEAIDQQLDPPAENHFDLGTCTWYVDQQWHDAYQSWIPWGGNADHWLVAAKAAGFTESATPAVGSVAVWLAYNGGAFGLGHVAWVVAVYPDGSFALTEMNWNGNGGGYDRVDYRVVPNTPASYPQGFIDGPG